MLMTFLHQCRENHVAAYALSTFNFVHINHVELTTMNDFVSDYFGNVAEPAVLKMKKKKVHCI